MTSSQTRNTLIAAVAVSALVAGGAGLLVGRQMGAKPAATAESHEEGEGHKPGEGLVMDAGDIGAAGIRLVRVSAGSLGAQVAAQATVVASPHGQALLAARADGAVVRLFKRVGEPVAAGETLALIESREAGTIAADRATATAKVTAARQAFAREKRLFEAKITARQDYEAAQAELAIAEADLRRATSAAGAAGVTANGRQIAVTSPISGRVTAAPATLGAFVSAGTELFRIADPRRLEVQAAIPGQDAARIAPGDRAQLEMASGETLPAVVRTITPGLDAESRAATAVLTLGGSAVRLQTGQSLRVRIVGKGGAVAGRIVVPEAAIQSVDGQPVVFVRTKTGFAPRAVVVGSRGGGQAELLEGLKPGEEIAGEGAFVLKAELAKGEAEHED